MNRCKFLGILLVTAFVLPLWLKPTRRAQCCCQSKIRCLAQAPLRGTRIADLSGSTSTVRPTGPLARFQPSFSSGGDFMGWRYATDS